ncbi:metalloregulator ArsR/SmtB family transcription factor (plasmid) [Ligilactobacillus salivarius]|uniref:Metalloregulator ArsR/SmtB family transcription factor n=1 Tax=Ligilactobacillus salivarius TaxID=1624 RepID=A0ABD7YXH4_9LACO|nr:metalloregulator ArsR/SmtB family transcription factor [Ligilactobacillus salivarius]WHS05010.1 metalloregulator ArsR/SmtB family transcription factor [Ligilactobacillus salivarius]WHS09098.1 metalloregulator ArsR/SmtB family transcription factor [Ligilactobacillus salivarius]WHS11121.1 metalloregulator ArsR/SmtB family transcription factor [Ligilactobacillus salivarius]WHS15062.1 metalloregulator ArsR/SmtB family transcription factor [Ligilactobacillus salivarius]WHS18687.1 metalloregulato
MEISQNDIQIKHEIYKQLAILTKGFSSDKRLEILNLLIQSPKTVEGIAKETGISVANTSRNLQILKQAHLVTSHKEKNFIIYKISSNKVERLVRLLIELGKDEVLNIDNNSDNIPEITLEQAYRERINYTFLDVRPIDEYNYGHIPEAINIPLEELDERFNELSVDDPIIVYCRGNLCVNTNIAANFLDQRGYTVKSLNSDYLDWKNYIQEING